MRMPEDQTAVPTGAGEAEPTPALVPAATSAPNVPAIAAFGAPGAGVLPAPDAAADGEQDEPETPDPLAEDPAFAAWPAEVRSAWAELELPSLHDLLLAQERLAAEVRRQNQELRRLSQAVAAPAAPPPSDSDALARSLAAAHHLGERLAAAAAAGLIALAESADRHAIAIATAVDTLLARAAGRDWLGRARPWPEDLRQVLSGQVEGARLVRDKARQTLADAGMTRVAPQAGESFDPETQRCLGTAPGQPGRIVRCERDGWRSGATLLRPADVIIGAAGAALPSQDTHP
jgi:hypothetical protein